MKATRASLTISLVIACASAAAIETSQFRVEVSIDVAEAVPESTQPSATKCNDNLCAEACYQHGDANSGSCSNSGQCVCNGPSAGIGEEQSFLTAGKDVSVMNVCDTFADCSSCWFYERCCYKSGGKDSGEKGSCMCGVNGRAT
ncbi:hypothetical protein GTA08_BOTSDO12948 [Botryosphaeria dothidea]|uniref:Uncharacterized protein n=1 Tax=Botryosphaeria dothidea TaxID=55169 RepID=A0A8H4J2Q6_9PEZI|nr:hypothetical protein GTA08_BOTSDO12948 [Botryosphaeria dothidea]